MLDPKEHEQEAKIANHGRPEKKMERNKGEDWMMINFSWNLVQRLLTMKITH